MVVSVFFLSLLFPQSALQPARMFFPSEPSSLPSESKFGLRSAANPTKTWSARVSGSLSNSSTAFNGPRNNGGMTPSGTPGKQQGDGSREMQNRKFDAGYQKDQFDLVKERVLSGESMRLLFDVHAHSLGFFFFFPSFCLFFPSSYMFPWQAPYVLIYSL